MAAEEEVVRVFDHRCAFPQGTRCCIFSLAGVALSDATAAAACRHVFARLLCGCGWVFDWNGQN